MENTSKAIAVETSLTLDEAMTRVRAAGWGGLSVWSFYNRRKQAPEFMACLIRQNGEPDHDTNLWDYTDTAQEALIQIVNKAQRLSR